MGGQIGVCLTARRKRGSTGGAGMAQIQPMNHGGVRGRWRSASARSPRGVGKGNTLATHRGLRDGVRAQVGDDRDGAEVGALHRAAVGEVRVVAGVLPALPVLEDASPSSVPAVQAPAACDRAPRAGQSMSEAACICVRAATVRSRTAPWAHRIKRILKRANDGRYRIRRRPPIER